MSTLNKDRILHSIVNQLNITNQVEISALTDMINSSNILDYDSIKLLSKTIKEYLKNNNIEIQHSIVLNILAKALGYQNHHSLKVNLSNLENNKIEIDIENDSILKKFFLIKDEFLKKFHIEQWHISHFVHKGHEFEIIYQKRALGLRSKEKVEVNKYLKSYGLKPYKNTVPLFKIKYDDIRKVAFNILQHYQSFFQPIWYENDNMLRNPSSLIDTWSMLSYSDIEYKSESYLLVDSYSTDLPWNIITNFLDYLFNFGTLEDIQFFEKCLKQKEYSKYKRSTKSLGEVHRIREWENQQVLSAMVKNRRNTIKETLEDMQCIIGIQKYMYPYMKELELTNKKSIKDIIIDSCDYFFNITYNYTNNDIKEKLFIDLFKIDKKEYIDTMEDIDDVELYRNYHDKNNCLELIASEIKAFIHMFKDVQKNYQKYYNLFKSRGYIL